MMRLLPVLLSAGLLWGMQEPEAKIRTDVRQVLVPVVVTDAKGHHATGLKATDFSLSEDGVPQQIVSFSSEADAAVAVALPNARKDAMGGSVSSGTGTEKGRTYVICFDTLHSSFANFARIRDAMEKLFQKNNGDGAQYVMVGLGRQLRVLQTATSDQKLLLSRIRDKSFLDVIRGVDAGIMAIELNHTQVLMEQYCSVCGCGQTAAGGAGDGCYGKRQELRQHINSQVERTILLNRAFLEGLKGLVTELTKVPGGRSMLLISDGFSVTPGAEFFAMASAYVPNAAEFRFMPETHESQLQQILAIASQGNVRVNSVDSRGVSSPAFGAGGTGDASNGGTGRSAVRNRGGEILAAIESKQNSVAFQNSAGPAQLAAATGGVYFHNNNDFLTDLRSAIADGREYYMLSYIPTNTSEDGKFRKITVEVRDKRMLVRAKDGYWAEKPQ